MTRNYELARSHAEFQRGELERAGFGNPLLAKLGRSRAVRQALRPRLPRSAPASGRRRRCAAGANDRVPAAAARVKSIDPTSRERGSAEPPVTEREPEGLDLSIQINFHTHVTASVRPGFTVQHLWTARRAAWLCKQREQYLVDTDYRNIDRQHRSHAITAVLSAVAFVEAFVNDVIDRQQLAIRNKMKLIDKCQNALDATDRPASTPDAAPAKRSTWYYV